MALEYKLEGDKLIVKLDHATGVDQDKDGEQSVAIKGSLELVLDGSEVADELLKSNDMLAKIKEKLKLG